jgi:type I restriction enzyme S subunit
MADSGHRSLGRAVDIVSDDVPASQVDPKALLVGSADLDGLGELTALPRRVADARGKLGHLTRFGRGDFLVTTTRSERPKVWLADRDGYCTSGLTVLRPNGQLDSRWLLWWLRAHGASGARGLLDVQIELSASRDESESVAQLLDLLESTLRRRRQALETTEKLRPATFYARLGDPLDQAGAWSVVSLRDLIAKIETGWSPRCADRPAEGQEWGVLKVSAVSSGWFLAEENKALPPGVKPREELRLKEGDLLMVRSNSRALVGATALVNEDHPRLLLTDKVWRLRPMEGVDPRFMHAVLSYPTVRRRLSRIATGNLASMQNLTQANLLDLSIAVPTQGAQREYVVDLELIERVERAQRAQAERLGQLLDVVLALAFPQTGSQPVEEVQIDRALFNELSSLQRAVWRTLAQAEGALTMTELRRRIQVHHAERVQVDNLRRALDLLAAAGVAMQSERGFTPHWARAEPYDPAATP